MKTRLVSLWMVILGFAVSLQFCAEEPATAAVTNPSGANGVIAATPANGLRLNFRGASLDKVLDYLSEAAGFVILREVQLAGTVDVWSDQLLTKDEALNLLDQALLKEGYAAIRRGRVLTIVKRDDAKTRSVPVKLGSDPEGIPQRDEMVTQILPVRFAEVTQLIKDLQPLISPHTSLTANESANTLVITDTQANIRRVAEVIRAIDSGAEDFTAVRVFHLKNANAGEMAELLANLFPDESRSGGSASPVQLGGPGPGFPGPPGGGAFGPPPGMALGGSDAGGSAGTGMNQRIQKHARVQAVADARTASVVVTASTGLIEQIGAIVRQLDADPRGKQSVAIYQMKNASAQQVAKVLQDAFQRDASATSRNSSQNDALGTRSSNQSQQNNNSSLTGAGRGSGAPGAGGLGAGSAAGGGGIQ